MKLVLTESDLERMPPELPRRLFVYLSQPLGSEGAGMSEGPILTRQQLIAILRDARFHRAGAYLHILLEQLSYQESTRPPSRERLMAALGEEGLNLDRHVATLNRMAAKASGQKGFKLCQHHRPTDVYTAHAATRGQTRELLALIKASGKNEEPPWS